MHNIVIFLLPFGSPLLLSHLTDNHSGVTTETQKHREKTQRRETKLKLLPLDERSSFDDKVLDDESNEDGDDCEEHEKESSALLVCQATSGPG